MGFMKNYDEFIRDEMLKNRVNMAAGFNPSATLKLDDNSDFINTEYSFPWLDKIWSEINNLKGRTPAFVELSCKVFLNLLHTAFLLYPKGTAAFTVTAVQAGIGIYR